MADHQTERVIINGRLNTRAQAAALGKEQNMIITNYVQEDDGSVRVRPPWTFPRRVNLLTVNQASLETDTTGWAAAVNCTIARDITLFLHGTASLRLTATGAGDMSATTPTGASGRAVLPNRRYSAFAAFRAGTLGRTVNIYLRWYNSGGTFISESFGNSADGTGFWSQVATTNVMSPATAAFAAIAVEIVGAAAAEQHYIDQIQLSHGGNVGWGLPAAGTPNGGTNVFWSGLEASNLKGVYVSRRNEGANNSTIHRAENPATPDWGTGAIDTIAGANYMVPFVVGNGVVLYGNFTFPNSRLRFWNGTVAAEASAVAIAGRALAYHKERFWSAGPSAQPQRLYYSGITDHTSWDLNNYVPVGPDDGGVIEDISPALGGLLIAKSNSIWFLSGDGPTNFVLTKLDGGEGQWGRCICPTPYGAVIAGTLDVYLWQGGSVEPITVEHPQYTSGTAWVTTTFRDDKVFITQHGVNQWVRDMAAEKWHRESCASIAVDNPDAICVGGGDLDTLIMVPQSGCDVALDGIQTRNEVSLFRNKDQSNRGATYQIATGFFPLGPLGRPVTVDRLIVSVMQISGDVGAGEVLQLTGRIPQGQFGVSDIMSRNIVPEASSGVFRYLIEGDRQPVQLFGFNASQVIGSESDDEALWEILDVEVEYHVEEPR